MRVIDCFCHLGTHFLHVSVCFVPSICIHFPWQLYRLRTYNTSNWYCLLCPLLSVKIGNVFRSLHDDHGIMLTAAQGSHSGYAKLDGAGLLRKHTCRYTPYLPHWLWNSVRQNSTEALLTHWGRDRMDAISQTTFSSALSWMKMFEFRLKFHWSLFLRVQLTIFQHWFR